MILHCMKKSAWNAVKSEKYWGAQAIASEGFIHCSTVAYFWRVAPLFSESDEDFVLVCIDKEKLSAEVRYEDGDNCGRFYPHIYGPVNHDAVVMVLPFLRDENGKYCKNPEFSEIEEQ